jgi:flavin-binding protein dodecin
LRRYRYRTIVLTGPWRESPEQAIEDAARAQQGRVDDRSPGRIEWNVPGRIEDASTEEMRFRLG